MQRPDHRDRRTAAIAKPLEKRVGNMRRPARVPATVAAILLLSLGQSATAQNEAEIAKQARCLACHAEAEQRLGPSFAAIAERYAGDEAALATLTQRLRAGSKGVWGKAPMPPVPPAQVSDADVERLLTWILARP